MDENIASANLTEQNALSSIVEKLRIVPGDGSSPPEEQMEDTVLNTCKSAVQ